MSEAPNPTHVWLAVTNNDYPTVEFSATRRATFESQATKPCVHVPQQLEASVQGYI